MSRMTATAKVNYLTETLKKIQRMNRNGLRAQCGRGDRTGTDVYQIAMKFSKKLDQEINKALDAR